MEELLTDQKRIHRLMSNFLQNFYKTAGRTNHTEGQLGARLHLLEQYWTRFVTNDKTLIGATAEQKAADDYFVKDLYTETEVTYVENLSTLTDLRNALRKSLCTPSTSRTHDDASFNSSAQTSSYHAQAVLPKINIPRFTGTYTEWASFKDLYQSLIQNNGELSDVQKFHYFKGVLGGEAAELVRAIPVTADNYKTAWDSLIQRYDNQRIIITSHLRGLLSLPAVRNESIQELKALVHGTRQALQALENLGRPVSQWDDWLVYITSEKLDSATRRDWENSISIKNDAVTYKTLETFLISRLTTLEVINTSYPKPQKKTMASEGKKSFMMRKKHSKPNKAKCPLCSHPHLLLFCPTFRASSIEERRNFVQKENLCYNCLRNGHDRDSCENSGRCRTCGQKHHSMLHSSSVSTDDQLQATSSPTALGLHVAKMQQSRQTLLATAFVKIRASNGTFIQLRALLDQGSEINIISETAISLLRIPRKKCNIRITGIGAETAAHVKGFSDIVLFSCIDSSYQLSMQALILEKLTNLPYM